MYTVIFAVRVIIVLTDGAIYFISVSCPRHISNFHVLQLDQFNEMTRFDSWKYHESAWI